MHVKIPKNQQDKKVTSSLDLYPIMQQVLLRENRLRRGQEHFWIIGLNNANKVLFIELVALGAQNRVNANPPDVFRMAIYKMAVKAVLWHNHPSGTLKASKGDVALTDRLIKVGEIIGIEVVDHLVIAEKAYLCFKDEGIMDDLRASDSWRLLSKEEQEIKELKEEIELRKREEKWQKEMAKKMLADKLPIDVIVKYTGLKKKVVENLNKNKKAWNHIMF